MKVTINKNHKSIPANIFFDIPKFCIITGKNGSGKSHLLEAISNSQLSTITDSGLTLTKVQLIGFGGLNPQIDEACDPQNLIQITKNWWSQIEEKQRLLKQAKQNGDIITDPITQFLPRWGQNQPLTAVAASITSKLSKPFEDLCEDDIYYNLSIAESNQGTMFASQLALIFKTYHLRYTKNQFKQYLNEKNKTNFPTLTDEEFLQKYGPRPWDLVNEILSKAGLTYEVVSPEQIDIDSTYKLRLIDRVNNTDISANDLSTGEKVLMSLALAIYNTHESTGKPEVLILDEPDAPLHPQYSKLLIETLRDIVVDKADVRVIVTTHSPSTVAMCPDNALFEMNRATRTPEMISVSRGIEVLTEGIPHLKVSIEERRQIFVESKYDVIYFQKLFQTINRFNPLGYQPIFLEPHSGTSNCTDVELITTRLHEAGSDLVRGIIDWDGKKTDRHPVYVLGGGRRYSIENYILDPIYVALSLVRAGKKSLSDFSVIDLHTYVDAAKLTEHDAQNMANKIFASTAVPLGEKTQSTLHNGWVVELPKAFLMMRGHDWEALLLKNIPELNAISSRNGDAGLKLGILQTIEEFPQFLPVDISETLSVIR
ncbi:putative ATPase [Pseudogulbenkiania sp. NH8B]|uniref:AAA family ATPase n=1 Tax=Pseudogulbenkiania sp. (strain NH8B) TaxID=748280 RepID=UPI0002279B4E|nr:ATP-binding protein [Pseudogulbenkiania sp. NH8B]BAK76483.1 putative ATPase [Pseudogulbenkiania sp. NH8B]BAK76912.1 putative ATPase [Pseudogulbenkiania sp. NH8B]